MRATFLGLAAVSLIGAVGYLAFGQEARKDTPPAPQTDPWVGKYLKYGGFDWEPMRNPGRSPSVTITKDGDTYTLSKPYETWKFKEIKKGVLSDGKGGIGTIYHGTATFADGHQVRILRAQFCYEQFILYGE